MDGETPLYATRVPSRVPRAGSSRRQNLSAVLSTIVDSGPISRAEVARSTALSPASVTTLTHALRRAGLVRELKPQAPRLGRPRIPLAVDTEHSAVLAIHIGTRATGVALVALDGSELAATLVEHAGLSVRKALNAIVAAADTLIAHEGRQLRILGTGLATGGTVDSERGVLVDNAALGWADVPLAEKLVRRLPAPLSVEQNVRAAAVSHVLFDPKAGDDFAVLMVTEITGAALVVRRVLQPGATWHAGSVDHLQASEDPADVCPCGRVGCLLRVATDDALVRRARRAGLRGIHSVNDVISRGSRADGKARDLLELRSSHVGRVAAQLIDLFDPPTLVVLGTLAETPEYVDTLRASTSRESRTDQAAGDRIVMSSGAFFELTLAAAGVAVAKVLADPASVIDI